jgi:hypothetical protein
LEDALPDFVRLVVRYRPARLRGRTLASIFPVKTRQPEQLRRTYLYWNKRPSAMRRARPALVFAVLGQARADHRITPERESALLRGMLMNWAMRT